MARLVSTTEGVGRLCDDEVELLDLSYVDLGVALASGVSAAELAAAPVRRAQSAAGMRLLAPIPRPSKIWAVGWAYRSHSEEVARTEQPDEPFIFLKAPSSVIASGEPVRLPKLAPSRVDYEGELAVVIGARATEVTAESAANHIAGYSIADDVSARDVQKGEKPGRMANVTLGKSFDTFTPFGPCLSTLDEFADPNDVGLRTYVDGELRQQARTAELLYPIPELIAYVSQYTTLEPGDVILTGTPAGVGHPEGRFLAAGSTVRIEIDGVGALEHAVIGA